MTTYFKNNMHYYIMHNISSFFQTYNEIKMKTTSKNEDDLKKNEDDLNFFFF